MKEKLFAVFMFILGVIAVVKTWYFIPNLPDLLPGDFLPVLYWIGYVAIVISAVFIKPIHIMLSNNIGDPLSIFKGIGVFFTSIFLLPLIDGFFEVISNIWTNFSSYSDMFGFAYIVIALLGFIIIPQFFVIGDVITDVM